MNMKKYMNMKKDINIYIEILAAWLLLTSKYFLVAWNNIWWIISIMWYTISFVYLLFLLKLPISSVSQIGLLLLNVYGYYKRTIWYEGLLLIDYIVVGMTILVAFFITYFEIQKNKKLWLYENLAIISWMSWFICLAFRNYIWRIFLIINLIILNYIFFKKKSYVFLLTQTFSIIIIVYSFILFN